MYYSGINMVPVFVVFSRQTLCRGTFVCVNVHGVVFDQSKFSYEGISEEAYRVATIPAVVVVAAVMSIVICEVSVVSAVITPAAMISSLVAVVIVIVPGII